MKNVSEAIKYVCLLLGAVIGAGFITGRELVSFFGYDNYLFGVILSGALFSVAILLTVKASERRFYTKALFSGISKTPEFFSVAFSLSCFITAGSASSALFEIFAFEAPLSATVSFLVLFLCWKVCGKGIDSIKKVNVYLTLTVIFSMLFLLSDKAFVFDNAADIKEPFFVPPKSFIYAFFNVFINIPIILRHPKNKKVTVISVLIFSLAITFFTLFILNGISGTNKNSDFAFPIISAVKNVYVFYFICLFSVVTSLFASLYPISVYANKAFPKTKGLPALFGVYVFSFTGLKNIVKYVYPIISAVGMIFTLFCAVYAVKLRRIKRRGITNNKK